MTSCIFWLFEKVSGSSVCRGGSFGRFLFEGRSAETDRVLLSSGRGCFEACIGEGGG